MKYNAIWLTVGILSLTQSALASTGDLFSVASSGTQSNISITLCLNAKARISCQTYSVPSLTLSISTTVPNHVYPNAGIFINTPGYTFSGTGDQCTLLSNGYCEFTASNTSSNTISIISSTPMLGVGSYANTSNSALPVPLLTLSTNAQTWTYPATVLTNLPKNFTKGSFLNSFCNGTSCMAVGTYNANQPWIAVSQDAGNTWSYPVAGAKPTGATLTILNSVSCSGSYCLATGLYSTGSGGIPTIYSSNTKGSSWAITFDSNTTPPPGASTMSGRFNSSACFGTSCLAIGTYSNGTNIFPMIYTSNNSGQSWQYTLYEGQSGIPTDYAISGLNSITRAACSSNSCIAAGWYDNGTHLYPYVVTSTNQGHTWVDTINSSNTPAGFFAMDDVLKAAYCNGNSCYVGGGYSNGTNEYPLLAYSANAGATWTYTIDSTHTTLPSDYSDNGTINSIACTSTNACVAVGSYTNTTTNTAPLMAVSANGGVTWQYVISTASGSLPVNYSTSGNSEFNSVSCNGTTCYASGYYTATDTKQYPMMAISINAGQTWTYRIQQSLQLPQNYVNSGNIAAAGNPPTSLMRKK